MNPHPPRRAPELCWPRTGASLRVQVAAAAPGEGGEHLLDVVLVVAGELQLTAQQFLAVALSGAQVTYPIAQSAREHLDAGSCEASGIAVVASPTSRAAR
jgi:hypothetical protein